MLENSSNGALGAGHPRSPHTGTGSIRDAGAASSKGLSTNGARVSALGSDKPMRDSRKHVLMSPGGERLGRGKWGVSRWSRLSETFCKV